jgi:hypothetical protein
MRGAFVALALLTAACHGTFRFDEHSVDAGVTQDAPGRLEAGGVDPDRGREDACPELGCGFRTCTHAGCDVECPPGGTCSGSCGSSCSAECDPDSTCVLTAAESASLACERARCTFVVGPSGSVKCTAGSRCDLRCLGKCSLTCAAGATCMLACGAAPPLAPTSGSAGCP